MKKTIVAIAILLAAHTGASAQDSTHNHANHEHKSTTSKTAASKTPSKGVKYTCTMHPEVVKSKPGKCPKCGMTLVKMKSGKKEMKDMKM